MIDWINCVMSALVMDGNVSSANSSSGSRRHAMSSGLHALIQITGVPAPYAAAMVCRVPPVAPGVKPSQIAINISDCSINILPAVATRSATTV